MKNLNYIEESVIESIISQLLNSQLTISVAESCTGGFVSHCFTSKKRASDYFKGAIIAYNNDIKNKFLDINESIINEHGVVSQNVAELMAINIRKKYITNFGLATTGYVDVYFDGDKECSDLYAWVSVSGSDFVKSKSIFLSKKRIENISIVTAELLSLFRKEII